MYQQNQIQMWNPQTHMNFIPQIQQYMSMSDYPGMVCSAVNVLISTLSKSKYREATYQQFSNNNWSNQEFYNYIDLVMRVFLSQVNMNVNMDPNTLFTNVVAQVLDGVVAKNTLMYFSQELNPQVIPALNATVSKLDQLVMMTNGGMQQPQQPMYNAPQYQQPPMYGNQQPMYSNQPMYNTGQVMNRFSQPNNYQNAAVGNFRFNQQNNPMPTNEGTVGMTRFSNANVQESNVDRDKHVFGVNMNPNISVKNTERVNQPIIVKEEPQMPLFINDDSDTPKVSFEEMRKEKADTYVYSEKQIVTDNFKDAILDIYTHKAYWQSLKRKDYVQEITIVKEYPLFIDTDIPEESKNLVKEFNFLEAICNFLDTGINTAGPYANLGSAVKDVWNGARSLELSPNKAPLLEPLLYSFSKYLTALFNNYYLKEDGGFEYHMDNFYDDVMGLADPAFKGVRDFIFGKVNMLRRNTLDLLGTDIWTPENEISTLIAQRVVLVFTHYKRKDLDIFKRAAMMDNYHKTPLDKELEVTFYGKNGEAIWPFFDLKNKALYENRYSFVDTASAMVLITQDLEIFEAGVNPEYLNDYYIRPFSYI